MALGGWVAFQPMHAGVTVMGDLVLLETEINRVMARLLDSGLDITTVHNHLLRATPATFYMHVGRRGDPVKMATAIREALAQKKHRSIRRRPRRPSLLPSISIPPSST